MSMLDVRFRGSRELGGRSSEDPNAWVGERGTRRGGEKYGICFIIGIVEQGNIDQLVGNLTIDESES